MLELFRVEAETQAALLTAGLLELERNPGAPAQLETLMRAAHSLKGAARIVNLQVAERVAHAMEDCFVAAQRGHLTLGQPQIDLLFRGVDFLLQISKRTEANITEWQSEHGAELQEFLQSVSGFIPTGTISPAKTPAAASPAPLPPAPAIEPKQARRWQ